MEAQATHPPAFIKLLAHDLRWGLLKALTTSDHRVQELGAVVDEPINLVSYHLKQLRADGLVTTRRSEADGRDVYYSLDLHNLQNLYREAGAALHPGLTTIDSTPIMERVPSLSVLFVCTHNSARSQMAEALLRHKAGEKVVVASAGSQPTSLRPEAVATMQERGIDIRSQYAKSLEEIEGQSFDYVVTVCDHAREVWPTFPGASAYLHWGFADPTTIEDAAIRRATFAEIAAQLAQRIDYFLLSISRHQ